MHIKDSGGLTAMFWLPSCLFFFYLIPQIALAHLPVSSIQTALTHLPDFFLKKVFFTGCSLPTKETVIMLRSDLLDF